MKYTSLLQRLRVPIGFLFAAVYLFFAPNYATPLTLVVGGAVALTGLVIRAWAAGHIVKNEELAVTGPYAHSRNPLYFGSFLIAAGFAMIAHWSLLLLVVALFAAVYMPVIERERRNVRRKFPDAYAEYERNVPSFVPRPVPWRRPAVSAAEGFSLALYMRHREWRAALAFVGVIAFIVTRMRFR